MTKIVFNQEMVEALTPEERTVFNSLAEKAKATTVSDGFDVKSYLERRKAKEADEEAYRKQMEESLNGRAVTQYY